MCPIRLIRLCAIGLLVFTGCVSVDPRPDYQNTSRMVTERTGTDEVYEPGIEPLIEGRISDLLKGGLTTCEAVRVALLNNRQFQSRFQEIGVSRAAVVRSGLLSNPSLFAGARLPDGGGRSSLTFSFAQELVDLWQIPVRKRVAQAQLDRTVLTVVRGAVDLAADVKIKCYRLLALERAEAIGQENLELAERSVQLARDRFDAGEVGKLDVNLARTNLLDLKIRLLRLRRDRELARAVLARVLGLSRWETPWTLRDSLPTQPLPGAENAALLRFAMEERLDARAAASRVLAAEGEIARQSLNVFPSVTLGVEEERPERRALPGRKILADTGRASIANGRLTAPGIQSRGERNLERRQIIDSLLGPTLSLTLPIWHQNQAEIAKARFKAEQARKGYEDLLDSVAEGIATSTATVRTAAELVRFYEDQSLPLARANVESARRAYGAGEQSIIALIDAQRTLVTQRRAYLDAERDLAIGRAELEQTLGGRMPPAGEIPATGSGDEAGQKAGSDANERSIEPDC
ncbi:MAG: TolC family protein [Phycisphaerae bacterium]